MKPLEADLGVYRVRAKGETALFRVRPEDMRPLNDGEEVATVRVKVYS